MIIAPVFYILAHLLFPNITSNAIVPKPIIKAPDSDVRYVYLSFDDGPLEGTSNCIDICLNQKVPATFFEVGRHQAMGNKAKALYNRILQNETYLMIANHSYTHANSKYKYFYRHPNMAFEDFMEAQSSLAIKNNIIRLPGNSAWNTAIFKKASGLVKPIVHKLDSAGFNIIGWDVEWGFNKSGKPRQDPQFVLEMVDSAFARNHTATKNHVVILMHDHMFRASEDSAKLVNLIELIKANPKFQLRKISQYPGLKNGGR
jgi:hypothetical protein